ncbi:MAG TPA: nucleotidyltransferase family protein [Syntrophorhabdaceae bacterium]|nr:nucleotidyltransferase family protein [Syntrophorhabdaceae bacterium]HOL06119.1 nucleotidyltransferase family protein [Syntrophorhabdaceae bacterium]HON85891.1 nucleotidyltransferase family protein [Syntrophorhabdaceae bacterium]HOT42298.1 nucleotidyltransferase family protein [Syntrophorhabdaceae bacterium]HPC67418.1 nucleotidyltransferase family protein [Syntrophorhabdaceae bacterium]
MTGICAVIFAAGSSVRLGHNKLLIKIDDKTVIERSVEPFFNALIDRIFVVTGFEKQRIEDVFKTKPIEIIYNPNHREGMASSLKAAIPFISHYEGVFFQLGDRPLTDKALINRMLYTFSEKNAQIIVPVNRGRKGHPVLIRPDKYLKDMKEVEGDKGLREIIDKYIGDVVFIEGDDGVITGIDTQEDLNKLMMRGHKIEKD